MKKFLSSVVAILAILLNTNVHLAVGQEVPTTIVNTIQAPLNLSFLTNGAEFASWALRSVRGIGVSVNQSSAGAPGGEKVIATQEFSYSGPPSLSGISKFLKGTTFNLSAPIPNSVTEVYINLNNTLPNGNEQILFEGGTSGRAEFDGQNWRLPVEDSSPSMYLAWQIFIPASGVTRAWVVETNQWGWSYKKDLQLIFKEGFFFEGTLAGEVTLCLQFDDDNGHLEQWVYDLKGKGVRIPIPTIIAAISIRDSEQVRDYGDNPSELGHWVYTYAPENSTLIYGRVPVLIANYTNATAVKIFVGSAEGFASSFGVLRMGENGTPPTKLPPLKILPGFKAYEGILSPGLYHFFPLGIDVCPDWWKITEVNGWNYGKGGPVPVTTN